MDFQQFSQEFDNMSWKEKYELAMVACRAAKDEIDYLEGGLKISEQGMAAAANVLRALVNYIRGTADVNLKDALMSADLLIAFDEQDLNKTAKLVEEVLRDWEQYS